MRGRWTARRITATAAVLASCASGVAATASAATPQAAYRVGPVRTVSAPCSGANEEVEQAVDRTHGYVYEVWMGCGGIGFARSTNGGRSFSQPITMPGAVGSETNTWDPAVAAGPDGSVYVVFMRAKAGQWYPIVAASHDDGRTFRQVTSLLPPDRKNWGDRPYIAVGPDGGVYVTWDYGPDRSTVTYICTKGGSCAFATGQLNIVMQKSTDGGRTFGRMVHVSPGFPASGGDSAPIVVEPDGRLDVLYQGYRITNRTTYAMKPGYQYFTSSTDGGKAWSRPVRVAPGVGTMSLAEWWIDGDIGMDTAGNLYATWDTQGRNAAGTRNDVGWLSYSTDHGRTWSRPFQAPADRRSAPHIMRVGGGGPGIAYVAWLTSSDPRGYAVYLRAFSISRGWLSVPFRVSPGFGDPAKWPGDTFGLNRLAPNRLALSWGSATDCRNHKAQVFATRITARLP